MSKEDEGNSFDHLCDTLLRSQLLGYGINSGTRTAMTSWKSESDPSTGIFLLGITNLQLQVLERVRTQVRREMEQWKLDGRNAGLLNAR
ncbi:hypothetical protein DVH24_030972 [Malus domestica]|uniref:Uncharacterized protein n=1 Tax=Malus domestica TaxID=3750 RepID=A0A498HC78_MALDO|nr:hypothetical protein DVH24_030972 [Malus domestica]